MVCAYRVATTALVERVEHWRLHEALNKPVLRSINSRIFSSRSLLLSNARGGKKGGRPGTARVRVLRGHELTAKDRSGTSDPYVELHAGGGSSISLQGLNLQGLCSRIFLNI